MGDIERSTNQEADGITAEQAARLKDHGDLWIARAMQTDPIEPDKIAPAIEGLYRAAGLKKPRIVIVPSPLATAFAYGASSSILNARATRITRFSPVVTKISRFLKRANTYLENPARARAVYTTTLTASSDAVYAAARAATSAINGSTSDIDGSIRKAIHTAICVAVGFASRAAISDTTRRATIKSP